MLCIKYIYIQRFLNNPALIRNKGAGTYATIAPVC